MYRPESSLHRILSNVPQHKTSCTAPPDITSNALLLPSSIPGIIPPLEATGSSPTVAIKLSDTCLKAAIELLDISATQGHVSLEEAQTMRKLWNAAHAEQARTWAEDAFSYVHDAVAKAKSLAARQPIRAKKPVFNHEYTPLLEKYFEYNAYPSAPDRAALARKSMMTPRQIEVWFQNHRNRARKDGKALRKLTEDPLPLVLSLKSLERQMPFFTIPEYERKPFNKPGPFKDDSSDEEDLPPASTPSWRPIAADVLDPPRPLHTFPTLYRSRCDYDPFPTKAGTYKFPPPVWFRKPAAARSIIKAPIDMHDFVADFNMKLHLRTSVLKKQHSTTAQSWCAWRVTALPSAPHPAFVRSPTYFLSRQTSHLHAVPAPSSRLFPFQSPGPFSQTNTLVALQHSNDTPIHRKVARLPKRTPKNTSIAQRRSPGISEASHAPFRSPSSTSCSSSFGSDVSSDRRSSSSSSTSSSSSSALTTPELPHAISKAPSIAVSGLDFQNIEGLFGDSRETLSLIKGMSFNFSMVAHAKHPSAFGLEVPSVRHLGSRNLPSRPCASRS